MYRLRRASVQKLANRCGNDLPRNSERDAIKPLACSKAGFHGDACFVAASRLTGAMASTLAVGTLLLGAGVTLAMLSIRAALALPIPT